MKKEFLVIAVLVSMLMMGTLLQAGPSDVFQKRFPVDPNKPAKVEFKGADGDLVVDTHDSNDILFIFEKKLEGRQSSKNLEYMEKIHPEITFENNILVIHIIYPKRNFNLFNSVFGQNIKVKSRLTVPSNTALSLKVVDGDMKVSGIKSNIALRTTDGDIKIEDCEGALKLHSTDGDITAYRCNGTLNTVVVDGDIKASGIFSGFNLKSVDGDAIITLHNGSSLKEDCFLRSVDGDVKLFLPGELAFKLDAKTKDGSIRLGDLKFNNVSSKKDYRFEGERGNGEYAIQIKTTDGDISLRTSN